MTCFVHPLELTGVARELDDMAVGTLDRTRTNFAAMLAEGPP
jgi:hypothetical protein